MFPQHPQGWTLPEVLALPEDQGGRLELIDGSIMISPAPSSTHQRVLGRIQAAFVAAVPPDLESLPGVNVLLSGARLLIPDLSVVTEPNIDTVYYKGADLLLAVEIHSPSTRVYDKALKRQLYAEAGVQFLLFVDPAANPVSATLSELTGDSYRDVARSAAGRLSFTQPFPAELDLSS